MPYSGITDPKVTAKLDRCVKEVMAQGHDKSSAIAICRASMDKEISSEDEMSRKESRERERRRRAQLQDTVIKDLADLATLPVTEETEPPADVTTKEDYAWDTCIKDQLKRYGSQDKAEKVCGAIRARYGKSAISVPENIYKEIETELGFSAPVAQPTPTPVTVKAQPAAFLSDEETPIFEASPNDAEFIQVGKSVNPPITVDNEMIRKVMNESIMFETPPVIVDYAAQLKAANERIATLQDGVKVLGGLLVKQGNRHNTNDWGNVQGIHDKACELGAKCQCDNVPMKETKPTLGQRIASLFKSRPSMPAPFTLTKDAKTGQLRFVSVASNNFRDDDTPRQIITDAAHKEFEVWLKEHPMQMPELWLWHNPLTKMGKADGMAYVNNFVVYTGLIDKGKEEQAQRIAKRKDMGVSHGMHSAEVDTTNQHITKYRTFELSPLLATRAANKWTAFSTIVKEVENMAGFDAEKRKLFEEILGKEQTDAIEKGTADASDILKRIVESKEAKAPPVTTKEDAPPMMQEQAAESADQEQTEGDDIQMLSDKIDALIEAVSALASNAKESNTKLEKLEKSRDEEIADLLTPKKAAAVKAFRPTQAKETLVKDGDKEKVSEPSPDAAWFYKEVVQPITQK